MSDRHSHFRKLHHPGKPFILANAWDAGSARMLAAMGAEAIATSSAAHAFTLGRPDGKVTREEALAHARALVEAVDLPVSGDFEAGYGETAAEVAATVVLAARAGLSGISVEDINPATGTPFGREEATGRIKAASDAARALPHDFTLLARADGIMTGHYDIEEALTRLKAFEGAGADALYAPLPATWEDQARICRECALPVNALAAGPYTARSRAEFAAIGVARISLGSSLARLTHAAIAEAGKAMFDKGDFAPLSGGISGDIVDAMLEG